MYQGYPGTSVKVAIDRARGGRVETTEDMVAAEEPLEIRVGQASDPAVSVSITMRTPGHDSELAAGFLATEGILSDPDEVASIAYAEDALPERQYNVVEVRLAEGRSVDLGGLARSFYTTSSCGVCGKASLDALYFQGC